ncbi:spondin domain-containing protein [Kaarinaea lacus]
MKLKHGITAGLLFAVLFAFTTLAVADDEKMYSVTITNITKGTLFTPILVVTHKPGHPVFQLGEPASEELIAIAEGGNTQPLQDKLLNSGMGYDAASTGAPLLPGESVTVNVGAKGKFNHISLAAMLLPTNDGFIAINGMRLPHKMRTKVLAGYDAGSEINDELCANIPGPHCGGSPFSVEDGEGYVHIHNGIHGIGNLSASDYDWKNPVATVKITRMK